MAVSRNNLRITAVFPPQSSANFLRIPSNYLLEVNSVLILGAWWLKRALFNNSDAHSHRSTLNSSRASQLQLSPDVLPSILRMSLLARNAFKLNLSRPLTRSLATEAKCPFSKASMDVVKATGVFLLPHFSG